MNTNSFLFTYNKMNCILDKNRLYCITDEAMRYFKAENYGNYTQDILNLLNIISGDMIVNKQILLLLFDIIIVVNKLRCNINKFRIKYTHVMDLFFNAQFIALKNSKNKSIILHNKYNEDYGFLENIKYAFIDYFLLPITMDKLSIEYMEIDFILCYLGDNFVNILNTVSEKEYGYIYYYNYIYEHRKYIDMKDYMRFMQTRINNVKIEIREYEEQIVRLKTNSRMKKDDNITEKESLETKINELKSLLNYIIYSNKQFINSLKVFIHPNIREYLLDRLKNNYLDISNTMFNGIGTIITKEYNNNMVFLPVPLEKVFFNKKTGQSGAVNFLSMLGYSNIEDIINKILNM